MSDVVGVRIAESLDELSEEELGFVFADLVGLKIVKEFSSFGQLHDHEDVIGGVEHFVELDDVGVANEL